MRHISEAMLLVEKELAQEQGAFDLFALFLREDSIGLWDLLVSADWVENDKVGALRAISDKVQKALTPDEVRQISRIVTIDADNPALDAVRRVVLVEHSLFEVKDSVFFNLSIKHAFIITSRMSEAPGQALKLDKATTSL